MGTQVVISDRFLGVLFNNQLLNEINNGSSLLQHDFQAGSSTFGTEVAYSVLLTRIQDKTKLLKFSDITNLLFNNPNACTTLEEAKIDYETRLLYYILKLILNSDSSLCKAPELQLDSGNGFLKKFVASDYSTNINALKSLLLFPVKATLGNAWMNLVLSKSILGALTFKYKYVQYNNKWVAEELLQSSSSFVSEPYYLLENPFKDGLASSVLKHISSKPLPSGTMPAGGYTYISIPDMTRDDFPSVFTFKNALEYVMGKALDSLVDPLDLTTVTDKDVKYAFELSKSSNSFSVVSVLVDSVGASIPKESLYYSGYFNNDIKNLAPKVAFDYIGLRENSEKVEKDVKTIYSKNYTKVKNFAALMGYSNDQLIELSQNPAYLGTSLQNQLNHKDAALSVGAKDIYHEYSATGFSLKQGDAFVPAVVADPFATPPVVGVAAIPEVPDKAVIASGDEANKLFTIVKPGMFVENITSVGDIPLGTYVRNLTKDVSGKVTIELSSVGSVATRVTPNQVLKFSNTFDYEVPADQVLVTNPIVFPLVYNQTFVPGMFVTGKKIPAGTYVDSLDTVNNEITLSKSTTSPLKPAVAGPPATPGDVLTFYPAYSIEVNYNNGLPVPPPGSILNPVLTGSSSFNIRDNNVVYAGMTVYHPSIPLGTFVKSVTRDPTNTFMTVNLSQKTTADLNDMVDFINFVVPAGENTDVTSLLPFSPLVSPLIKVTGVVVKNLLAQIVGATDYFAYLTDKVIDSAPEVAQFLSNNGVEVPDRTNLDLHGRWSDFLELYSGTNKVHTKNVNTIYEGLKLLAATAVPGVSVDTTIQTWLNSLGFDLPSPLPSQWSTLSQSNQSLILTAMAMMTKFPLLEGGSANYTVMDLLFSLETDPTTDITTLVDVAGVYLHPRGHFVGNKIINTNDLTLKQSTLAFNWVKKESTSNTVRAKFLMMFNLRGTQITTPNDIKNLLTYTDSDMTSALLLTTLLGLTSEAVFNDGTPAISSTGALFANVGTGLNALGTDEQSRATVLVKLLEICHDLIAITVAPVPPTSDKKYAALLISQIIDYAGDYYNDFVDTYGKLNTSDLTSIAVDLESVSVYDKAYGTENKPFVLESIVERLNNNPILNDTTGGPGNHELFLAYDEIVPSETVLINNYTNVLLNSMKNGFTIQEIVTKIYDTNSNYNNTYLVILIVNTVVTNKNKRMTKSNYDLLISLGLTHEEIAAACYAIPSTNGYVISTMPKRLAYLGFDGDAQPVFA